MARTIGHPRYLPRWGLPRWGRHQWHVPPVGPGCRRGRRKGFSLTEVLLALSILGIGMAMVMAVFPAAVAENRNSVQNVLGTIICENGLSICKVRVPRASITGTELMPISTLSSEERSYPAEEADNATRGFLALGRRLSLARNEYQLVIVSYAKRQASNDVEAQSISKTVDPNNPQFTVLAGQEDLLQLGSPVIDAATGNYATIIAVDRENLTATLDHPLGVGGSRTLYFIIETDGVNPISDEVVSPAMTVMVTRTGLNQ